MSVKNKLRDRVGKYLLQKANEYKELLHLQGYHDPRLTWKEELANKSYMEVEVNYPYRFINISFSDKVIEDYLKKDFGAIDRCVLHEMIHIVLSHLYDKASTRSTAKEIDDALEDTVEHVTRIVWMLK